MTTTPTATPRPPDGDWLGTRFLRFRREGPFAVCTLDRPGGAQCDDAGDVLRHQVRGRPRRGRPRPRGPADHRHRRRLRPRRRHGRRRRRQLADVRGGARDGRHAVREAAPVDQAGGVRGQRAVPGRRPADRAVQRHGGGERPRDLPGARAVPRHRRHVLQPDAGAPDRPGPHPRPDAHRPHADRGRGRGLGHGRAGGAARRVDGRRARRARPVLPDGSRRQARGQVQPRQLHGAVRPHRYAGQLQRRRGGRGVPAFKERRSRVGDAELGASRAICGVDGPRSDAHAKITVDSSAFSEYRFCCTVCSCRR